MAYQCLSNWREPSFANRSASSLSPQWADTYMNSMSMCEFRLRAPFDLMKSRRFTSSSPFTLWNSFRCLLVTKSWLDHTNILNLFFEFWFLNGYCLCFWFNCLWTSLSSMQAYSINTCVNSVSMISMNLFYFSRQVVFVLQVVFASLTYEVERMFEELEICP